MKGSEFRHWYDHRFRQTPSGIQKLSVFNDFSMLGLDVPRPLEWASCDREGASEIQCLLHIRFQGSVIYYIY